MFLSGLLAGSLHVVSGPDHVAAIAPLSLRTPEGGSALGAVWGLGHGGGVALWVAGAALLRAGWGYELPSAALEAVVGAALMALGVVSYLRASAHEHHEPTGSFARGGPQVFERSAHARPHAHASLPSPSAGRGKLAAFAMGALHGSAGATHLLALLPTLGLPTRGAVAYAVGYLLAGVLAMASVGSLIGRLSLRLPNLTNLRRVCALSVLSLGTVWLASAISDLT